MQWDACGLHAVVCPCLCRLPLSICCLVVIQPLHSTNAARPPSSLLILQPAGVRQSPPPQWICPAGKQTSPSQEGGGGTEPLPSHAWGPSLLITPVLFDPKPSGRLVQQRFFLTHSRHPFDLKQKTCIKATLYSTFKRVIKYVFEKNSSCFFVLFFWKRSQLKWSGHPIKILSF